MHSTLRFSSENWTYSQGVTGSDHSDHTDHRDHGLGQTSDIDWDLLQDAEQAELYARLLNGNGRGWIAFQNAPVAERDTFSFDADETNGVYDGVNLLDNDLVASGGIVTHVNGVAVPTSGAWFSLVRGDIYVHSDGQIDFTASAEFGHLEVGELESLYFTYTVDDGTGVDTQTAEIRVNGLAPIVTSATAQDDSYTFEHTETTGFFDSANLLANDDGAGLTVTHVDGTAIGGGAFVALSDGVVYVSSNGAIDYGTQGAFDSLAVGATDTVSFSYTIMDGSGGTDIATVTLTIRHFDPEGFNFGRTEALTYTDTSSDQNINGQLSGEAWVDPDPGTDLIELTYGFPDEISDFLFGADIHTLVHAFSAEQRAMTEIWLDSFAAVAPFAFTELTGVDGTVSGAGNAVLKFLNSNDPPGAYANYPSDTSAGGDAFFGNGPLTPAYGSYDDHAIGHELGHQLGLSHGHTSEGTFGVMNADRDSREFSLMTYRDYIGGGTGYGVASNGGAQSPMMYDIAALQFVYGANFNHNSGDTTYSFDAATGEFFVDGVSNGLSNGTIFRTIWDGGGIDTYDFSNFLHEQRIDLTPGGWSDLAFGSLNLRADLGGGSFADTGYAGHARAHVFNALQYEDDPGSLIENAFGGFFADVIFGNVADNHLQGGLGDDTLEGGDGDDTLDGGSGLDVIDGGLGHDSILGDFGQDSLLGGKGADTIHGGEDNDTVLGEGGRDSLLGGAGADFIQGGNGVDTLEGGLNNDTMNGGIAGDEIRGDDGADSISGAGGGDTIWGGNGNDTLRGANGSDTIYGEQGADLLLGEVRNDYLDGGADNDTLRGGDAGDTLVGGAGDDDLRGENNADTFVFANGFGVDRIRDFDAGNNNEKIDLSAVTEITDYADLLANHMVQVGSNVFIEDGLGNRIRVDDVLLAEMNPADFIF